MRSPFSFIQSASGGGAAPTLTSVSPDIGNPAGGGSARTITGDNFTGATGVTFGGTSATSVVVVDDEHITCTVPAHAAGAVSVVVTTPSGSNGANTAYEYWDPTVLGASALWQRPNYATGGGGGTWTKTTGHDLTEGTTYPDASSGSPDFVRANSDQLSNATQLVGTYLGSGSSTIAAVVDIDSIESTDTARYNNEGIVVDTVGYAGLMLGGPSSNQAQIYKFSGTDKGANLTLSPASGRKVLVGKCDAGAMMITQNGGSSWTTGDTGVGAPDVTTGTTYAGRAYNASKRVDGRIKVLCLDDRAWTTSEADKFYRWANAEHP